MPRGPLADSYMRLSTPRQRDGDGLRRQAELRDRWLARHLGIPLRETFADIGVSGFRGKHRIRGALSLYLEHIRAGEVIKGDFFLVEDMDRMTREPVSDALKLVISILESGVTICVLNTDWSITLESFNRDASHVFMLAAAIQRRTRRAVESPKCSPSRQRGGESASTSMASRLLLKVRPGLAGTSPGSSRTRRQASCGRFSSGRRQASAHTQSLACLMSAG
jgi:hypothetical protein